MLYQVCKYIKNFFVKDRKEGKYKIENSTINLPFLVNGQYFMIENSILNDGVYKYPCTSLTNEEFEGTIVCMAVPPAFIELVEEIASYDAQNSATPYVSESFGGYSYTKATNSNGAVASWQQAFATRLNAWKKV